MMPTAGNSPARGLRAGSCGLSSVRCGTCRLMVIIVRAGSSAGAPTWPPRCRGFLRRPRSCGSETDPHAGGDRRRCRPDAISRAFRALSIERICAAEGSHTFEPESPYQLHIHCSSLGTFDKMRRSFRAPSGCAASSGTGPEAAAVGQVPPWPGVRMIATHAGPQEQSTGRSTGLRRLIGAPGSKRNDRS